METVETIAQGALLDNESASYDKAAKRLLASKSLLAFILKNVVPEFSTSSQADIANKYIEGNPADFINKIPVDPDLTNAARKVLAKPPNIKGRRNEVSSPTEGTNTFDIIFSAIAPSTKEPIGLIINVEAQKTADAPRCFL